MLICVTGTLNNLERIVGFKNMDEIRSMKVYMMLFYYEKKHIFFLTKKGDSRNQVFERLKILSKNPRNKRQISFSLVY
jgi:type IV secretory pathway ATPase VirB11/archaellum biosynthesis ATPase